MLPHPTPTGRSLLVLLLLLPGCRSTPESPPLTDEPELAAFARQVEADLEAHAWQDLLAVAQRRHYRTQVEEHGMSEPQYLAELFGLHRVDNDIKRGQRMEWSDLERIESVRLESLSPSGPDRTLRGTVTLRDGTTRRLQARIAREGQRYVLTGGVG